MRSLFRIGVAGAALLGLAACLPGEGGTGAAPLFAGKPAPAVQPTNNRTPFCTPAIYGHLKGQTLSASETVPAPKRIIGPGDAVTADHNPSRTNIEVDESGTIIRVFCG